MRSPVVSALTCLLALGGCHAPPPPDDANAGAAPLPEAAPSPEVAPEPPAPPRVDRRGGAWPHFDHPLRRLMRRLDVTDAPIEWPCDDAGCRPPLARFADALDATALGEDTTTVLVFGNSLIAADGVTDVVRRRLVRRFGDGGRGLLLADRMADYGPRRRTANDASGWRVETTADFEPDTEPIGLTGVLHLSEGPAFSRFDVGDSDEAIVYWRRPPGGPDVWWRTDVGRWAPLRPGRRAWRSRLPLPEQATRLELRVDGPGVAIGGVALAREAPGVVLDVFGVPSADARRWLGADEALFSSQLADRDPDLVMVMLGGNEAKRIAWGVATPRSTERSLRDFLERLKAAAPQTSCLVVGPIDAVEGGAAPKDFPRPEGSFEERPQLKPVIDIERRVALESGCGFFDLYTAMGGKGSLERLSAMGLLHDDLTHPKQKGLDVLGQLIADALLDDYARTPADSTKPAEAASARLGRP